MHYSKGNHMCPKPCGHTDNILRRMCLCLITVQLYRLWYLSHLPSWHRMVHILLNTNRPLSVLVSISNSRGIHLGDQTTAIAIVDTYLLQIRQQDLCVEMMALFSPLSWQGSRIIKIKIHLDDKIIENDTTTQVIFSVCQLITQTMKRVIVL